MDFSTEDKVDGDEFNRILWKGIMRDRPYPDKPSGLDFRGNRKQVLERYRSNLQSRTTPAVADTNRSGGGGR